MAKYDNNRQNGFPFAKTASTVINVGDFLEFDGSGGVQPVTGANPVVGVSNESVASTDLNFAGTEHPSVSRATGGLEFLTITITPGFVVTYTAGFGPTFIVGETVVGTSSTATGVVLYDNGSTTMRVQVVTGTFINGVDTITGLTSGATGTTSASVATTPASVSMVGSPFNIDPLFPGTLDVSGAGT